jgi:VCBS repeat-containing protein
VDDLDATVEVFVDGTSVGTAEVDSEGNWTLDLTGSPFGVGTHAVTATATDLASNAASTAAKNIEIIALDAVNDDAVLGMGDPEVTIHPSVTAESVQVLNVASGPTSPDAGTTFTVEPDHVGEVAIEISQVALAAVAKGFRVDVYDADENLIYSGVTEDSLVGDVGGLEVLGVAGDDTLTAVLNGLAPGEYRVVVGNDESKLAGLLGEGLTLKRLGDKGVVLGPDNQDAVLTVVENALNEHLLIESLNLGLGTFVRGILEPVLDGTTVLGAGEVVGLLTTPLDGLGITGLLDVVVDELANALLQNTLDAFEFTDITTTVTEYSFDTNAPINGNVIEGEAGAGEDKIVPGSVISEVKLASEADGTSVPAGGSVEIEGLYGTLTLSADGSYSYVANGDPASVGQSDVFTYTLSDGHSSDTADLSIVISGGMLPDLNPQSDNVDLDMGAQSATVHVPETDRNVTVLGLVDGDASEISGVPFTVVADHLGEMHIEVGQMALAAVASAFAIDVLDADGNVVFTAITPDSSLVGDVATLPILGVTGSDTLVTTVTGLEPGSYTVVVRSDESAISNLLTGLNLQELGDNGVILGQDNQDLVLDAVDTALGGNALSGAVRGILELTLKGLSGLGVDKLIDVVSDTLTVLGLGSLVETVLAAVAKNLVSNTLTLLQSTEVTTTLTEYQFEGDLEFVGNVVTGEGDGNVSDGLAQGGVVTQVTNSAGEVFDVLGSDTGTVTIAGLYGQLTISKDGSYTYDAKGARAGLGEEEVFTYTVTNGAFNADGSRVTEEATLTIAIDGQGTAGDIAFAGVKYDFATESGVDLDNEIGFIWALGALGIILWTRQDPESRSIEVEENTTQDLTITVSGANLLSLGGSTSINLEKLVDGTWEVERSFDSDQLVGLLGLGSGDEIIISDLTAGEYRVSMQVGTGLLGLPGSISASLKTTVTKPDAFVIAEDGISSATGNLLENDVLRGGTYELKVSSDGTTFESTTGGVTVEGTYGSLTVQEDGSYIYTPNSDLAHFDALVSESFTYQVAYDGGPTEEAELTVFVTPSGAGMPDTEMNSAGFDFSNLETFAMDDGLDDEPFTLTLEDVLGTDDGEEFVTLPEPEEEQTFIAANTEEAAFDLAALDVQPVVDPLDDQWDQNSSFI